MWVGCIEFFGFGLNEFNNAYEEEQEFISQCKERKIKIKDSQLRFSNVPLLYPYKKEFKESTKIKISYFFFQIVFCKCNKTIKKKNWIKIS